jgi:hypothetical protein
MIFIKLAASADVLAVTAECRRGGVRNFSAKGRVEAIMDRLRRAAGPDGGEPNVPNRKRQPCARLTFTAA